MIFKRASERVGPSRRARRPLAPPPGVGYYIREISRAYARALQTAFEPYGVTPPQFFYLRVLWEGEGINQMAIGARIGADRGTTSFVLSSMARQGMIERRADPLDARKVNVYLTKLGRELRTPLLRSANKVNALATRGFAHDEVEHLKAMLRAVSANVGGAGREPTR